MRRRPGLLAVLALAIAGCGADTSATEAVQGTADRLADVRSGVIDLRITVAPERTPDEPVGFVVKGPFSLPDKGGLPTAELAVTQLVGREELTSTLTLTKGRAWITADGTTRELDAEQRKRLSVGPAGGKGILGLEPGAWLEGAEVTRKDGIDEVRGTLDLPRAVTDILQATGGPALPEGTRKRLAGAVTSSQAVLRTGAEDQMLRELSARATLDVPEELRAALKGVSGAVRLTARLVLKDVNEPVRSISPPA